jgi:PAS domain-containing protein
LTYGDGVGDHRPRASRSDLLKAAHFQLIKQRRSFWGLNLENPQIFRAVLKSLKMGVCVVDRDRKSAFWNDGAKEMTGYMRQEVLGRSCREDPSNRRISLIVRYPVENSDN